MNYENTMKIMDDYENLLPLLELKKQKEYEKAIQFITEKTKCDETTAKAVYSDLTHDLIEVNPIKKNEFLYIPHCPTCSSANIKKISTTTKAINTAMWGISATKRHKTFHCNSCGYEW